MKIFSDVLNFREALHCGGYMDDSRPVYAISYDEAMDVWREMNEVEERRYIATRRLSFDYGFDVYEIKKPEPLPCPLPGRVWGFIYGVRVYVEEIPVEAH